MSLEQDLAAFLAEEEQRKTSVGKRPMPTAPIIEQAQPPSLLGAVDKPNMWQEILGNAAWAFADEWALGMPGLAEEYEWLGPEWTEYISRARDIATGEREVGIDPETGEEVSFRAGPQTTAGKAASAVGTVGGFIVGAPMKVVKGVGWGLKGLTAAATGRETLKTALKKGAQSAEPIIAEGGISAVGFARSLEGGISKATTIAARPGKLNNLDNFVDYVQSGIKGSIDDFVSLGKIDKKTATAIGSAYSKYLTDRPLTSMVDYFTSNMTNKRLAYTVGSIIQEGFQFGMLDGIREGVHVLGSRREHEYDLMEPVWGAGLGVGFGALKWMSPAGKSSSFKVDFLNGLRGKLGVGIDRLKTDSYSTLKIKAGMLGADAKAIGTEIVDDVAIMGKKFKFDLTNVESEVLRILDASGLKVTEVRKADLLREVFTKQADEYGKQLIKWAKKSEWLSLSENWKKMVLGSQIMNARAYYDMSQGVPMGIDDIMINTLLGAFLNRRGTPRRVDMFPDQIHRLRSGLHQLGILPPDYLRTTGGMSNPYTMIPTLDPAISSSMNPFASDRTLNEIVKAAESKGITTMQFDGIDTPIDPNIGMQKYEVGRYERSVNQSGEDLSMFRVFHRYLNGASVKNYTKNLDSISETTALEIQKLLSNKFTNIGEMRNYLRKVNDNAGAKFEGELAGTAVDVLRSLGVQVGNKTDGNIGRIPTDIIFDQSIVDLAEGGKLGGLVESFAKVENQSDALRILSKKLKIVLNTTMALNRASKRDVDQAIFVRDLSQLEALSRIINTREVAINNELGLAHTASNSFNFEKVWHMAGFLQNRIVNQKVSEFSKMLDKNLKDHSDVFQRLMDSGLLQSADDLNLNPVRIESIDQITIVDTKGANVKDSKLISENKLFLSSILEVLGAKGQYNTTQKDVRISIEQINRLKSFLNEKGLNTDPNSLANFATETVRRITYQNFQDSKLTPEDIDVFQSFFSLGSPTIGEKFSLMKYDKPSKDRPVGIIANKVEYLGSNESIIKIAKEYNNFIDAMIERGKVEGKDEGFVKKGETYILTEESSFTVIQSVLHDAITKSNNTARRELMDFMVAHMGKDRARDATLTFMSAYPQKTSKLVKLMINTGALELKPGEGKHVGTFEYYVNKEQWAKQEIKDQLLSFIDRHGINLDTLDVMTNDAQKKLETYLEGEYSTGDHKASISPNQFFERYLPEEIRTPEAMKDWFNDRLFDARNNFKGWQSINNILESMKIADGQSKEAYNHLMQVLSNKLQSTTKKVFYFSDGEVRSKDTDLQTYKTPYFTMLDKMGITYALVDGMSHDWVYHPEFDKLMHQPLDIFQSESNIINKSDKKMIQDRKNIFMELLRKKTDIEGFENGFEFIDMPGLNLSLVVSKSDLNQVKVAYEAMYKRHINNTVEGSEARNKLENFKEKLEATSVFNKDVVEAMRSLIAESMSVGANKNKFIEFLEMNETDLNKYFVGRQTMFNTMKFKRVDPELMKAQAFAERTSQLYPEEALINKHYLKKGKFGVAVFDDGLSSFDLKTVFEKENGAGSWAKYYGDRKTESAVDSITFISEQMADFLGFHYGAPGSKVFKPIISSQGEGNLLYGKTAFVYDTNLEKFFKSNPDIDILMSASADKLKLYSEKDPNTGVTQMLQIPKDKFYNTGAVDKNKIIDIPLNAVGVQSIKDYYAPAKIAPSVINNHTDVDIAQKLYNDYYSTDIAKGMQRITEILDNPFIEHELMRQMKSGMATENLENIDLMDGSNFHTSLHLEWLNTSPYASLDVFGPSAKMNPIKAKFLDKILAPTSEYRDKHGKMHRYGAKSVISQHFGIDLQGTKFNPETGQIERYGEIMLPQDIGGEGIDFTGRNFKVKVINTKNNEVSDAKEIFMKQIKGVTDPAKEQLWKSILTSSRPLENLFNQFEQGYLKDYDIAISAMRYPRTRPNDLHLLRLKGFLKGSGNSSVVNPFDVYHIFEGDYDIDAIDYFWGSSDAWVDNIKRQQKIFVPTADVSGRTEVLPEIQLLGKNSEINNLEWQKLNGNQRALSNIRGTVQATSSLVKHVDNIAAVQKIKNPITGETETRKILLRNPNPDIKKGENGYWEVEIDWNNADFHLRQALEGQILLDATSPDPAMLNKARDWRYDFLFPKMENSLSKDDFIVNGKYNTTNLRAFINGKKTGRNEYADKRARIFRRYEIVRRDGELVREEVDLRDHDIDAIGGLFKEYSQLLEVVPGRKVHTQGNSKTASYEDILMRSQKYFLHAKNVRTSLFGKLNYKQVYDDVSKRSNFKYKGSNNNAADFRESWGPKSFFKIVKGKTIYDKQKKYSTRSPFPRALEDNMLARSRGETGGIIERMLYEIWDKDPLNSLHMDTKVLTNDSYIKEQNLARELLTNENFDIAEMADFIPNLIGSINHDIDVIARLKYQAAVVNKKWGKNKTAKLNELNRQIKKLEEKIKPLLTEEYWKGRKAKDIGRINLVDIQSDRNIIDGTVQYFTLDHLSRTWYENHGNLNYKPDLKALRRFIGKEYGNLNELQGLDAKRKSIYTSDIVKNLSDVKTGPEIEITAEEMLTAGALKHGSSFLWDFAMPSVSAMENKIGVFNGNVVPVAISPGGNYKRVIRWLLKGKAGLLPQPVYNEIPKTHFTRLLEGIAEVDFVWRRYFNGQNKHLPMDATEVQKLLTYGVPKWNWRLNNMFSKYTDIKSDKKIDEFNPFGMGKKYDMNIAFFRSLSNLDRTVNATDFEGGASILSHTNQLMMENGYLTPQKHLALLSDASSKLGPMMEKVFPSQVDIRTGAAIPLKPFDMLNNPIYALLGGGYMNGGGLSLDPNKAMNSYERTAIKKMTNQVQDMRNTTKDHWEESFKQTDKRLDINKKPGDC